MAVKVASACKRALLSIVPEQLRHRDVSEHPRKKFFSENVLPHRRKGTGNTNFLSGFKRLQKPLCTYTYFTTFKIDNHDFSHQSI